MKVRIEGSEKQREDAGVEFRDDEVLTPSYHGERCRHSGADPQYECCCDECDYFLCCFPEYEK